jgi:undecaprenyl-diphosphatase
MGYMLYEHLQAVVLGLTQGLTEFIPVSSSGHLILVGNFLQFPHSGLAFDVALDIGTLLALYIFFARDFYGLVHDAFVGGPHRRLAIFIALATLPAVIAGVLLQTAAETVFRSPQLVAVNLIWVGVIMYAVDRWVRHDRGEGSITLPRALGIGLAQALALVPGVSRSGATITAGRAVGLDRVTATRFSFLLSAPVITGATLKVLADGDSVSQMVAVPTVYAAGIVAAFVSGYLAIKFLIKYLEHHGLGVFALYRIALGVVILVVGVH